MISGFKIPFFVNMLMKLEKYLYKCDWMMLPFHIVIPRLRLSRLVSLKTYLI